MVQQLYLATGLVHAVDVCAEDLSSRWTERVFWTVSGKSWHECKNENVNGTKRKALPAVMHCALKWKMHQP